MKVLLLLLITATTILTGCGNKNSGKTAPSTNSTAGSTNGSSINYLGTLMQADKNMTKTIDVSYLNEAIQQFNVQEGHYPKDLQELVPNYVAKLPTPPYGYKLDYDASSGTVKVVPQRRVSQ
jgi:hypothetical protein